MNSNCVKISGLVLSVLFLILSFSTATAQANQVSDYSSLNAEIIKIKAKIAELKILLGKTLSQATNSTVSANQSANQSDQDSRIKQKIGQMILIGFRGTNISENSDFYKAIKEVGIGGVALTDYDAPSNTFPRNIIDYQQTKKLISDMQKYSETPLFVAIDAEGGNINRLKPKCGFLPIVSAKKMGQDKTLQTTYKESVDLAGELKGLGFNMNLAPVVDVDINPKNPVIGSLERSFSPKAQEVADNARIFIQNHLKNNIITVEKHFPGHGSSTTDSHKGLTDITNVYLSEELLPYQKLNDNGLLKAIMAGHLINKKIDKNYPASLSKNHLQNILRDQIGFKGVIISDDIQMAAISDNYKLDEAIIAAINAGTDIISFSNNVPTGYDADLARKAMDIIFDAVKENKISEKRITESYDRIINLKKEFSIIKPAENHEQAINRIRSKPFELIGQPSALTFGEALDIATSVAKKISIRPAFLMSIFQEELKLEKFDMCCLTNFATGEGVRPSDGKKLPKVMKPGRDIEYFLMITKKLGKDPAKTLVTCPMSFGWGGAMGPADFIPSTWMQYKAKIESLTKKPADPWNINDAFLAAGLYLSESGAKTKTRTGEWNAAMIYFSGTTKSPYTWYADGAMAIADAIQTDIDEIERNIKK